MLRFSSAPSLPPLAAHGAPEAPVPARSPVSVLRRLARGAIWVVVLGLAVAFATFVWPTRYRYDHMTVDGNIVPVRVDRFTGDADMLVPDDGWEPVESPPDATEAPGEPQKS